MATLGERVINQKTGDLGTVIGYGHEIVNNVYTATLKVRIIEDGGSDKKSFIKEDIVYNWKKPH